MIVIVIIVGFIAISLLNYFNYKVLIDDDTSDLLELSSENVKFEIDNITNEPVTVALTMANSSFVIDWIKNDEDATSKIVAYLTGFKEKYGFNSVFLVSDISKNYYYFDGINKVVSPNDSHDVWYYNFIEGGNLYEIDIDADEVAKEELTTFVNCRIEDDNGELIGVTGVGLKTENIQKLISEYERTLDVDIYLIDRTGVVRVSTDATLIENYNMFDQDIPINREDVLDEKPSEVEKIEKLTSGEFVNIKYMENLDWYIVIKKDNKPIHDVLISRGVHDIGIMLLVLVVVLFIINKLINNFRIQLFDMTQIDQLTQIANRAVFDKYIDNAKGEQFAVAVLDIDKFKNINDTYGHILGDDIIKRVVNVIKPHIKSPDIISRWGGDEFGFVIHGSESDVNDLMLLIIELVHDDEVLSNYQVTVSIGLTFFLENDTPITAVKRADNALYLAKENGRDQYVISKE